MLTMHPKGRSLIWKLLIRSLAFLNFASYLQKVKAVWSNLCFIIFGHLQKGYSGKVCFPFGILILLISAAMNAPQDVSGSTDGNVTKSHFPILLFCSAANEQESKESHMLIIPTHPGVPFLQAPHALSTRYIFPSQRHDLFFYVRCTVWQS